MPNSAPAVMTSEDGCEPIHQVKITSEYDISLNAVAVQLNGTPLETIAAAPMVRQVQHNVLYYPNLS